MKASNIIDIHEYKKHRKLKYKIKSLLKKLKIKK